jgi:hypothetical protein
MGIQKILVTLMTAPSFSMHTLHFMGCLRGTRNLSLGICGMLTLLPGRRKRESYNLTLGVRKKGEAEEGLGKGLPL